MKNRDKINRRKRYANNSAAARRGDLDRSNTLHTLSGTAAYSGRKSARKPFRRDATTTKTDSVYGRGGNITRGSATATHTSKHMDSDGSSTASTKNHKKSGRAKWYAVVRGRTPGVYSTWGDAWAQTDGHSNSRPYKFYSYAEAVECFMRWHAGVQIHGHQSTMRMRGEVFNPAHSGFFGSLAAEQIRIAANTLADTYEKTNARMYQTQDINVKAQLNTGSAKAHRKVGHRIGLPVEGGNVQPNIHQRATADDGKASRQPRVTQEQVGGGLDEAYQKQERRIEDLTSLVQRLSRMVEGNARPPVTSTYKEAGIAKPATSDSGPAGPEDKLCESQRETRDSSLGAGSSNGTTEYPNIRPNAVEVSKTPSPASNATPVRSSPSVGMGAVGGVEVKYGRKPILLGEPRNNAAASPTSNPAGGTNQVSFSSRNSMKPNAGEEAGGIKSVGSNPEVVRSGASEHRQIMVALAEPGQTRVQSVADIDEIEKYAEELFNSNSSEANAFIASESTAEERRQHGSDLRKFGFKSIPAGEAERIKRTEVERMQLQQTHDTHVQLSGGKPRASLIPKRKRGESKPKGSPPIPRKVEPSRNAEPTGRTVRAPKPKVSDNSSSDEDKVYSAKQIRAIRKRDRRELAKAIAHANSRKADEEAMQLRIYDSQPQPKQRYRQRLRKAVYFHDTDSSDAHTITFQADNTTSSEESVESVDRKVWTGEPKPDTDDIVKLLRKQVMDTQAENRALRDKLNAFMDRMSNVLTTPNNQVGQQDPTTSTNL